MTTPVPPFAPDDGQVAVSLRLQTLTERADFLRTAAALRQGMPSVHLQARPRPDAGIAGIRVGYTCSKKVGNAVMRNRAKRRLRAAAREILPQLGRDGWDYVLVGRHAVTASVPFAALLADLRRALARVHA